VKLIICFAHLIYLKCMHILAIIGRSWLTDVVHALSVCSICWNSYTVWLIINVTSVLLTNILYNALQTFSSYT